MLHTVSRNDHCYDHMQSIELKFTDVDSLERSNGDDLLGSIQHSLSQAAGGFAISKRLTTNDYLVCMHANLPTKRNFNLSTQDSVDQSSDYAPSFIYTDMFANTQEDNSAFHTPSLSLESAAPV